MIGDGSSVDRETLREMDRIEHELEIIHRNVGSLEKEFSPSLLRRFFDHLKNQDEKILFALVKFYLFEKDPGKDTFDKLDILLTRLSESPGDSEFSRIRDLDELRSSFEHLSRLISLDPMRGEELRTLVAIIRDIREEIEHFLEFNKLMESQVVDRFREIKARLGKDMLNPDVLVEIVMTNITLKNKFKELYQHEEVRILEDTNRIFEIERYIEKNPDLAHDDLRRQLDIFKISRRKFDQGRKENNVRREDVVALRGAMEKVLHSFEPASQISSPVHSPSETDPFFLVEKSREGDGFSDASDVGGSADLLSGSRSTGVEKPTDGGSVFEEDLVPMETIPDEPVELTTEEDSVDETGSVELLLEEVDDVDRPVEESEEPAPSMGKKKEKPSIMDILPQDLLLTTALHKIVFALELVVWDYPPEQAARATELHHMKLEPWEVGAYRLLMEGELQPGTITWLLQAFFLSSAALRVKMEEERGEIIRIRDTQNRGRLMDILDHAAQSLERARDIDRRFRWFIDDMLFGGDTEGLERIHRSHFRFLHAYSGLWLEHQASGGVTPL